MILRCSDFALCSGAESHLSSKSNIRTSPIHRRSSLRSIKSSRGSTTRQRRRRPLTLRMVTLKLKLMPQERRIPPQSRARCDLCECFWPVLVPTARCSFHLTLETHPDFLVEGAARAKPILKLPFLVLPLPKVIAETIMRFPRSTRRGVRMSVAVDMSQNSNRSRAPHILSFELKSSTLFNLCVLHRTA